jgi:hypothetical protein
MSTRESIREVMQLLESLPCGAIGEGGATLEELEGVAAEGRYWYDDAMSDIGQRCWRMLEEIERRERGYEEMQ